MIRNVNICTTLGVEPHTSCNCNNFITITRGSTAELVFNLNNYPYLYSLDNWDKHIDQLYFLFKKPNGKILKYKLFKNELDNKARVLEDHFSYVELGNYLSFIFSSAETMALFEETTVSDPVKFEVAIQLNTENTPVEANDTMIIEKQPDIVILDSIYSIYTESELQEGGK